MSIVSFNRSLFVANVEITYRVLPSGKVYISNNDKLKIQKETQKVIDKEVEKVLKKLAKSFK